jgi:glycosyltransferase involved in cell wall biosynthesis
LHYKKGLDYLIEAFAITANQIPDVDLVIAGPDGGAQAQLQRDIERLKLKHRVHIVGALYGREKYEALVDAYCFCLPSRQEGFSNAITEAMACGTPVVISENCNFPEVEEAGEGSVVKLAADPIAAALISLLRSPIARDAAGRAGRAMVLERFTWGATAARWVDYVQQHDFLSSQGSDEAA